jgi:hypothetical protein
MVEGNLPGPLERAVVLCRGAATNCYDMPSPAGARARRDERKKEDDVLLTNNRAPHAV